MTNEPLDSVDESLRQAFEAAWIQGPRPDLSAYLPPRGSARYPGTLEELTHIDLEFRWKQRQPSAPSESTARDAATDAATVANPTGTGAGATTASGSAAIRPSLREYVESFSELRQPDILGRLLQSEFEYRHRFGEQPDPASFLAEYADLGPVDPALARQLKSMLKYVQREGKPDRPGDQLGRYTLVAEHGRGGFGAVWRADDSKLGRRIALKRLSRQLARTSELRRRFLNEARITARLEHPGIVPIYDISNLEDDHAYYTMKLVRGQTLAEAIQEFHQSAGSFGNALEFRRLLTVFLNVCQTIRYCHDAGVLHRDLKPQNVIVGNFGESIVLDWGLACFLDAPELESSPAATGEAIRIHPTHSLDSGKSGVKGTPAYMAPEQTRGTGAEIGVRTDVYGLGAVLYHLLAGQPPLADVPAEELLKTVEAGRWRAAVTVNPLVPRALDAICRKAMAREPAGRYASVSELARDVENFLADRPVTAYAEPWTARIARWTRHHPTLLACAVLTLIFLSLGALVGLDQWQRAARRELLRLGEIRSQVERADAMASSQLQASRFDSAVGFWNQAAEAIAGEPAFADWESQIAARRDRAQRLDDFYRLAHLGQEKMFFDQLRESSIYSQAALDRIGVLEHADWWQHLPDQDLSAKQRRDLREQVYRQLGVLATMRMAEQAESTFSIEWLTDVASGNRTAQDLPLVQAAIWAADQGNRYRPARTLQIISEMGQVLSGTAEEVNLLLSDPLNGTDAAMLGSILDTHAPRDELGQALLRPFLGMRDPDPTARQWLRNAIAAAPEWHWLSIFVGTNELRTGRYEDAIRSFSHSIGVKSDDWVAYLHRALAHLQASKAAGNRRDRVSALKSAAHDLQRAHDLESENSFLFWADGLLASSRDADDPDFARQIRAALLRHPATLQIQGGHFAGVSKVYLDAARAAVDARLNAHPDDLGMLKLRGMLAIWEGNFAAALTDLKRAAGSAEADPEVAGLIALAQAQLAEQPADREAAFELLRQVSPQDSEIWLLHFQQAEHELATDRDPETLAAILEVCDSTALANWQRAMNAVAAARGQLATGKAAAAISFLRTAIQEDLAVDLSGLQRDLVGRPSPELEAELAAHFQTLAPRRGSGDLKALIQQPALLNGDFELGLSYEWGNTRDLRDNGIWTNVGDCQAQATLTADVRHSGNFSLHLNQTSPRQDGSYGRLVQVLPVTAGETYRLRAWIRGDRLSPNALSLGLNQDSYLPVCSAPEGNFEWTLIEGTFQADRPEVQIEIRIEGPGEAWLDDLQLNWVEPAAGGTGPEPASDKESG